MLRKSKVFYINLILSIVVTFLAANSFSLHGHTLIQRVLAAAAQKITGGGTLNFVALFTEAANPSSQIGDSIIYDDGAGHVGIGTTSPGQKLEVNGAMKLTPLGADPAGLTNGTMWMRQ